ncbi:hypothetical protein [Niabella ginsenosidivorans]|nr:hypothetical protein [Niabella ginsenosidivorans]
MKEPFVKKKTDDLYNNSDSKRDIRINWELTGLGSDRKWYYL